MEGSRIVPEQKKVIINFKSEETTMESARILIEVTAGIIPGQPMADYTKKWAITSKEWDEATDQQSLLAMANGRALGYAGLLMLQPSLVNWVRTDWIWL